MKCVCHKSSCQCCAWQALLVDHFAPSNRADEAYDQMFVAPSVHQLLQAASQCVATGNIPATDHDALCFS
jgi:hypothetical protein